jgi:hypothetical protein
MHGLTVKDVEVEGCPYGRGTSLKTGARLSDSGCTALVERPTQAHSEGEVRDGE